MKHDLLEYMRGSGRMYELQYDIGDNQGTQTVQTQLDPHDPHVFYHVKNQEWERLYADGRYIYREADTSEAPDRYYVQTTDGQPGAIWAKRFMEVGEVVHRMPLVIHYWKANCQQRHQGRPPSDLKLVAVHGQHTFPSGLTLADVLVLGWLVGSEVEEEYYYAKGFGLVSWKGRGRGQSYICELHENRPDLVRETVHCLPPLGNLYYAPAEEEVETMFAKGVDVSEHQGPHVDWNALRQNDGVSFTILRATVGMRQDSTYLRNYRRAGEVGILRGAYHYFYPVFDARAQARRFAETVQESELPFFLDVEESGMNAEHVLDFIDEFQTVTGRAPMIYTSISKWHGLIGQNIPWARNHELWVAHYTDQPQPLMPDSWDRWTFWQYSMTGRLSGHSDDLDLDYFNGTVEELRAYAAASPAPAETLFTDGFDYPVGWPEGTDYYVAAGVAEQDYYNRFGDWHTGEDWNGTGMGNTDLGDPVYAVANGVVKTVGYYQPSWGNVVLIEHTMPGGTLVWSQYAHLRDVHVREDEVVERGHHIGTIGRGHNNKYWAHLHFEIRRVDLPANAWNMTKAQVLDRYYHPTEFIKANRPGTVGVEVSVEEGDPNFVRSASTHWNSSTIGHKGHAYWTYCLKHSEDCVGEWRPALPQTGLYEVMAFIPRRNATSEKARYQIKHRRGTTEVVVNQARYYDQWVSLGRHPFSVAPSMPAVVRLSDQTGEPYTPAVQHRKKIAFDAIRFVLVERE
jgi:GH25 family lysozyme M1 (1,4-beta-N-acetylmuramidase)